MGLRSRVGASPSLLWWKEHVDWVGLEKGDSTSGSWHPLDSCLLLITCIVFRAILLDKTSRNLFFFLCLNLSFAFVELLYGIWSNW